MIFYIDSNDRSDMRRGYFLSSTAHHVTGIELTLCASRLPKNPQLFAIDIIMGTVTFL